MADVLNRCIKCQCRLSASEKPSKLLPCLHVLCEDCISGRTDAAEKVKLRQTAKNKQAEESSEDKPSVQSGQAEAANSGDGAEKGDKEAKVKDAEDNSNEERTEEHVQETGQSTEESDAERERETPKESAYTPLKECPGCKEPFSDESIMDNVFICKKAEVSEPDADKEQMCTGCEANPAASYCLKCDDWLCSDCVTAHKRVRMTKDHQLSSLEEAAASKSSNGEGAVSAEMELYCSHHPKEKLSLFCEKCEVLTCRDCQLLKHQEHKFHFVEEAADSYKVKLKGSVSLMRERRAALHQCLRQIEERLETVTRDKVSLQREILHQADVVVKAVRARVASVLASLHSFTQAACKRLSREVGDIGDLVCKFNHCIDFMDAILDSSQGRSLLYSKTFVEAKCRKVYHTQMEPQSLKGPLKLQYRHDVPGVLQLLPSFGAIYINGTKYPPEKQGSAPPLGAQNNKNYSRGGGPKPGINAPPPPQDSAMTVVPHAAQGSSAVNLVVPSSNMKLLASSSPAAVWAPQGGRPGSQKPRVMGVMVPGSPQPRVVSQNFPGVVMNLRQQPAGVVVSLPSVVSSVLSSQAVRGPPPYSASVDGSHPNSGSQAAQSLISRTSRPGNALDPTPDTARPASGGRTTPDRPVSSDGAAANSRVKPEQSRSNKDCVISSFKLKARRTSPMVAATLGEMQKNLDDVIRSVPLDLGDHLQPISGYDSLLDDASTPVTATSSAPALTSSSTSGAGTETPVDLRNGQQSEGDQRSSEETAEAGAEEEQEEQAKGYPSSSVSSVSMPGYTVPLGGAIDPNDDYCAACHQGGDVLCCDRCPRVFHLQCHVPVLPVVPSGAFVCTLCEEGLVLEGTGEEVAEVVGSKRKAPTGLSDRELKVCERILLDLFCHPSSIPFHEPVNRAVPNYYKIISSPMDFTNIKCKLSRSHFNHYATVESFLDDCKLVFSNCATYNAESSEVGKAGKLVRESFHSLVATHLPHHSSYVVSSHTAAAAHQAESERKKRRLAPPSSAHSAPCKDK